MTPAEFRELLQRKGASAECPVCGAEDWRGLDDVIDLPVRVAGATPREAHVRIPGFEALAPSCGRCGHVRLIDLRLLEAQLGPGSEAPKDREQPPDHESPETSQPEPKGRRAQPVTDLWGQPLSKRRGRKR